MVALQRAASAMLSLTPSWTGDQKAETFSTIVSPSPAAWSLTSQTKGLRSLFISLLLSLVRCAPRRQQFVLDVRQERKLEQSIVPDLTPAHAGCPVWVRLVAQAVRLNLA